MTEIESAKKTPPRPSPSPGSAATERPAPLARLVAPPQSASAALLCFIAGATVFAAVWSRFFRRGPLEYLLNGATKLANSVR